MIPCLALVGITLETHLSAREVPDSFNVIPASAR